MKYRIVKKEVTGATFYYVQRKFLFFWLETYSINDRVIQFQSFSECEDYIQQITAPEKTTIYC